MTGGEADSRAEAGRVARELERLHGRAMEGLRTLLAILDRQAAAARRGSADDIQALTALEEATTGALVAVERSIRTIEGSARLGPEGAGYPGVMRLHAEHDSLRELVLERNRATRSALRLEIDATRRELVGRRARMGTPSPFAAIGEAMLLDMRI